MKILVLTAMLLFSVAAWSQRPNPSDYPLTVHVTRSRMLLWDDNTLVDRLNVLINGRKFEMDGHFFGLISVGDYKARLKKDDHRTSYVIHQTYEILFPDKRTETFQVVGESE